MKLFAKIVNGNWALTAFVKRSILEMSDSVLKTPLNSGGKKRDPVHKHHNEYKRVWI